MRPIIFFDVESTGNDVAKDRIVSLAYKKFDSFGAPHSEVFNQIFNPGQTMTAEVIAIHGITNEQATQSPPFSEFMPRLGEAFTGCDLAGFNLTNFDVPILWEEFYRCGFFWDLDGIHIIDAGNIYKKKEPRSLPEALKFYCGREHTTAHSALGDVDATFDVFIGQLDRYKDLAAMASIHENATEELARFSRMEDRVDLAGKIVRDKDGDPVYNIGKSKGVKVKHDPSFARWMLGKDFSVQTKLVLEKILDSIRGEEDQEPEPLFKAFDQE